MTRRFRLAPAVVARAVFVFVASFVDTGAAAAVHAAAPPVAAAQGRVIDSADDYGIVPSRDRVAAENRMLTERLDSLLPALMAEAGLDMWLVLNREYAEDPAFFSLVPQPVYAARRTTMLVFVRRKDGTVERLSVNRYPFGTPYEAAWTGGDLDAQWKALGDLIVSRDPKRIGVNVSRDWPVADGLTHALHERLLAALPTAYRDRVVPAEKLVIRWLETRSPTEIATYPHIVGAARGVIAEAFSSRVITPGLTTTDDVAWYIRSRFEALGVAPWFMPYVHFQRAAVPCAKEAPDCAESGVILPGDVLHTDVGFCYLKLCTDTQEMAYVLRAGEDDVPEGLQAAMRDGNRWQDFLTGEFVTGRTGNEVLARTRAASEKAGIVSSTYSHALGMFGHAPGPTIGMWDNQGPTAVQGDWPLHPNTGYAIEGYVKRQVPEWNGQWVQVKLEQSALFDGRRVIYLAGRQTAWHVIR